MEDPGTSAAGRCWALILAAGSGERLGRNHPKAFVPLAGCPLLRWSIETIAYHPLITDVLTVVPSGWEVAFRDEVLAPLGGKSAGAPRARVHASVEGGPRRQDSSRLGLLAIRERTPDAEIDQAIVVIHDAARPVVSGALVTSVIVALQRRGPCAGMPRSEGPVAIVPVIPVEDTLKAVSWPQGEPPVHTTGVQLSSHEVSLTTPCGQVSRTVPRKGLWRAQTPQGFFLRPILDAHLGAVPSSSHSTDDVTLYEMNGWPVEAIPGSRLNLKVARPEDLALLEAWLLARRGAAPHMPRAVADHPDAGA